ncbi:pentatricopeptide repeat-containing protein At3g51320 isoform X1 [Dendrobium catenatum]|uniref:Pentatricopeptide repeat-containing protein n=1 Tax=Dendrobium catenatum TaxID=906689 RepID=A0A2I0WBJ0_9ASPA|nr:pentatricopeptide repeat-containing protein At3g51320 isoform X1 [Dendrobium catenatum]PKU73030.1 Pentatricopeptide repeat-containing protein [Dendrobium catenatum]
MNGPVNIPPPPSAGHTLRAAAAIAASGDAVQAARILLGRHRARPSPPDTFSVNTILKILSFSPSPRRTLPFFFRMLAAGFSPNFFTFPCVAASAARSSDLTDGEISHSQAFKRGATTASVYVGNAFITMYAACGLACGARALFDEMPQRDIISWNAMVDGYVKVGDVASARELFELMPERNVVSWNAMINGYLKGRLPQYGLKLFREMMRNGFRPSITTLVSMVTACGRLGAIKDGKSVHGQYIRNFDDHNLVLGTALVDMYSRCGKVEAAKRVFDVISERNLVCWNAMIRGHCIHGSPEDGLALFEELVSGEHSTRISPDEVTFIAVLCACARAELLDEGKKYFNQMTNIYNLKPTFAHYWCLSNLYGSLGFIHEAVQVLMGMPEETESLIWSGLLGLCRFHGDLELGERIAKRLMELEPSNISAYTLLQNIYVAAYRWEDAYKVKNLAKERRVRLKPGHRLVDLNDLVHNFKVGDRLQPEIDKIYMMMDDLASRIKLASSELDCIKSGQR